MKTSESQMSLWHTPPTETRARQHHARQEAKHARTIAETLTQMRTLHDELNQLLYTSKERPVINSPADAAELVKAELATLDHEELLVMLLDRRNGVRQIHRLYVGSVNSSQVRIGEIFKEAIRHNASAIIVVHNHPSLDPTPSPEDVAVTRAMVQAGKLLDVDVLDHLVIGGDRFVSLKERRLGFI